MKETLTPEARKTAHTFRDGKPHLVSSRWVKDGESAAASPGGVASLGNRCSALRTRVRAVQRLHWLHLCGGNEVGMSLA